MSNLENIEELIKETGSLIDLEKKLNQLGYKFNNYKEYINWLDELWKEKSKEKQKKIFEQPINEAKFPTLEVKVDCVNYVLHGISHGIRAKYAPGWQIRKNVKKYIKQNIESFHKPEKDECYLYEQHMHNLFDLPKSQELTDQTGTKRKNPLFKKIVKTTLSIPLTVISYILMNVFFGVTYIYSKTIKNPKDTFQQHLYLSQKALTDEKYQNKFVDFCLAEQLPQPLNIEKEYLSMKGSNTETFLNSWHGNPHSATVSERSFWTAEELKKYAKEHGFKTVHYIGGLFHIPEIEYFLKNPEFSFENLKKFKKIN